MKAEFRFIGRTLLTLLVNITAVLLCFVGGARAEVPKLILDGTFGSAGATGIAVEQSTGDVYVAGFVNFVEGFTPGHVDKFSDTNALLPPSPFGEGPYQGVAVNPTTGNVYVVDVENNEIDTYDSDTGALLSSFPGPKNENPFFNLAQIATDSAGNVYVPNAENNEVLEYSPTGGAPLQTFMGQGAHVLSGPTGVAIDSLGNVWVADNGNNRIEEFSPAGMFIKEIGSNGVTAISVDQLGDVFAVVDNGEDACGSLASPCDHLVEYSSAGAQVADIGAGDFGSVAFPEKLTMVAVSRSSGRVYVTDGLKNLVWIFGPPTVPVVGKELTTEIGTSEAKLGALINPGGIQTSYSFEYGTEASVYGHTTPFPKGSVGEGVTSRAVWATAVGLVPGTTYHYRVVATSALGEVAGPDQTFTTETAGQASCPNERFRSGLSANLPDCRAYELVTPANNVSAQPDTHHGNIIFHGGGGVLGNHAASEGNRMSYQATEVLPGSRSGGFEYVATRGAGGWTSENVSPLQSYTSDRCPLLDGKMQAYSADLSMGVLTVGVDETGNGYEYQGTNAGCGADGVEVVSGEPLGVENLLLRNNVSGTYQLINVAPLGVIPANAEFVGASTDLSHVFFRESAQLTPDAPINATNLYEWANGVVRLVTVLPDGAPVTGSLAASDRNGLGSDAHVISADGQDVFFTANEDLYVRINGNHTVQIDKSQGGAGPGGESTFWDASADGSQVFFTDEASAGLTDNTVPGSGKNLYHYDLNTGKLTDLTPGSQVEVEGVSGISEDGAYVYFLAQGRLSDNESANKETAEADQNNLYMLQNGTTTFIARLKPSDALGGGTRVSPNGVFLTFPSEKSLTGYDNTDVSTERLDPEIYLYSADSDQLACVSCDPSGEPSSSGGATVEFDEDGSPHYLSDSGQVFFETQEALLPSDTNGQMDIYEYENGQLHLISTGTSSSESVFLDASENGNNVFFLTRQKLLPQDTEDEALNIYDVRVDGGFLEPSLPPACTTADSCRAPAASQPPIFGSPSSQTFSGAGNLASAIATPTAKTKTLTRTQRLAVALEHCRKDRKRVKRQSCENQAKRRYGPTKKKTKAKRVRNGRRASR
jgi:DNA-binding beta-propeller fold protein YncE